MKRTLLVILSVGMLSMTGCGCGPFSWFKRGDSCQQQQMPCGHFDACGPNTVCHSGVLGGTIVGEDGIPTIIEGGVPGARLPGPGAAAESVAPGRQ